MSRKILITGASSDIGIAICKEVVREDDEVILHCFQNKNKLTTLVDSLKNRCQMIASDFSKEEEIDAFCNEIFEADILVNAAAVTITGLLPSYVATDITQMMNVNILAAIKITQKIIPSMLCKRNGCIVNISSVAPQRGNKGQSVYAGTKGFIESFTRSLSSEYGGRGIRVNCVAPGPIQAGSLNELLEYADAELKKSVVSKRLGTPQDVASMVKFLCSDEASFINGKILQVDGGFCKGV